MKVQTYGVVRAKLEALGMSLLGFLVLRHGEVVHLAAHLGDALKHLCNPEQGSS